MNQGSEHVFQDHNKLQEGNRENEHHQQFCMTNFLIQTKIIESIANQGFEPMLQFSKTLTNCRKEMGKINIIDNPKIEGTNIHQGERERERQTLAGAK